MSTATKRDRSPIAARIRLRLGELGLSETAAAERLGWTRTVLSSILRRVDAGGGLNTETLAALEKLLGKPAQWLLSGEEPAGVRLDACPGWDEAVRVARERWQLTDEQIAHVAACRFPVGPRHVDAALVRAISDAI